MSKILVFAGIAAGAASSVNATVLTFSFDNIGNGGVFSQNYGDRVTTPTNGSFNYGVEGGFTPNVVVDYALDYGGQQFQWWDMGFSDLQGVAYNNRDRDTGFEIALRADAGWEVELSSFDLGNAGRPADVAISVRDGSGTVLFSDGAFRIPDSTNSASAFVFDQTMRAQELVIRIDTTGLGISSDRVGIDNIQYSQIVPAPASAALLGMGGLAAARRRRA